MTAPETTAAHAGLQDLFSYPVTQCLQDRRTRRVAQGVSLQAGEMTYESANEPSPLTPLEEAILIAATGPTGATMHDGPLDKPNGKPELGTPFLHVTGRAASSADNCQATSLFMINDEAIWLIERPRERARLHAARLSAGRYGPDPIHSCAFRLARNGRMGGHRRRVDKPARLEASACGCRR